MKTALLTSLAIVSVLVLGSTLIASGTEKRTTAATLSDFTLPIEGHMPALSGANGWVNSKPLSASDLRGRVVVVNFWTFTCINSLRMLPHLRAWSDKYRDQGVVVIGVHSPEFGFEMSPANVRRATRALSIDYPVLIDSEHAVWEGFGNQYWPATYIVDVRGHIRYHHFGEGSFEETERVIQLLLGEGGRNIPKADLATVIGLGAEASADWDNLRSQENYLGYERTSGFASPKEGLLSSKSRTYKAPESLRLNGWALTGNWTVDRENIHLNESGGRILYRFHARDFHLVMGATTGALIRFRVTIDRKTTWRCPRHRYRCRWDGNRFGPTALSADQTVRRDRREAGRDPVSRPRRGSVFSNLRLIHSGIFQYQAEPPTKPHPPCRRTACGHLAKPSPNRPKGTPAPRDGSAGHEAGGVHARGNWWLRFGCAGASATRRGMQH